MNLDDGSAGTGYRDPGMHSSGSDAGKAVNILIILTNHEDLGTTGKKTGWYLPELAHPYHVFDKENYKITLASPKGGIAPMDPSSAIAFKDDAICNEFLANANVMKQVNNTVPLCDVNAKDFKALFFAGGPGPMFDLPDNATSNQLACDVYEQGGVVSAVCHGPVGLANTKLSNGEYLVKGHEVTSITNSEEIAISLMEHMPFELETRLIDNGCSKFNAATDWACNVVTSGRIVTGQNPASSTGTAEAVIAAVKKL